MIGSVTRNACLGFLLAMVANVSPAAAEDQPPRVDYLSIAQGVVPVAVEGDAAALKVGLDQALLAIDGDAGSYGLTPRPGKAESSVAFVYKLPALTTFAEFAVPNVLETPSPFQTFVRTVEVSGSDQGPGGPYRTLASTVLTTHTTKGQTTSLPVTINMPVNWVRVSFSGGIRIERDKTFLEFSEIYGYGHQEPVPLLEAFSGKWKGRGVLLELRQEGARVTGCYDGEGELNGSVSGNILRATGTTPKSGIPSTFVLSVGEQDDIIGVRSTNGAPFRLYHGSASPNIKTKCSQQTVPPLGCGATIHGINFDYDSASIRPESDSLLEALAAGLKDSTASTITVIGHTSSEGSDAYNSKLSQARAEAVTAALAARGIDAGRVSADGRGETQPIADNATEAGRSLNRRVEISCLE